VEASHGQGSSDIESTYFLSLGGIVKGAVLGDATRELGLIA
jgi:hypothetical protein